MVGCVLCCGGLEFIGPSPGHFYEIGIVVVSYVLFCVGFSSGKGTHIDLGRAIGLPGLFANNLSHGPWNYQAVNLLGVCALVLYRPG